MKKKRKKITKQTRAKQKARVETLARQSVFLQNLATVGIITAAAKKTGMDRKRHYDWKDQPEKYPDYVDRYHDALEQAADLAETEMVRRGIQGWDEPIFGKLPGKDTGTGQVGVIRRFSDRMLELTLKSRRPEKFRERFEHSGPKGKPISFTIRIDNAGDADL